MGSPPEASAAFIAHSADLDRRKMAADMLHFLGVLLKGSVEARARSGESRCKREPCLTWMDKSYGCLQDHSSAELLPRDGVCP